MYNVCLVVPLFARLSKVKVFELKWSKLIFKWSKCCCSSQGLLLAFQEPFTLN